MVLDFKNFPQLQTDRLILRNIENTDVNLIHKLHSDEVVNAFVGRDNSSTLQKAQDYILKMQNLIEQNKCIYWIISFKESNDLIGSICLWNFDLENEIVEIGYEMLSEFQGKGIMSEAIKKVIEYAFGEIQAKTITAFPSSDNINSVAMLKKMNFEFEDKKYNNSHEKIKNLVTYTLRNNKEQNHF
ncbi:GNAT family N-acetyltransferase [Flavobacterium sp. ov086]|uniref:GNAT family N-acetyltransferase n=1 Tax=Flavobacterium sp. ov086 TaxID=1761785 RepID=UPI000B6F277A|nr:GNAT family N-acetyltransferase [Flavobacterium sp. ov086]SNR38621.1 ribosomal-protein-alanine N-acetyltransferase [Flavobacterium sp. ov086]